MEFDKLCNRCQHIDKTSLDFGNMSESVISGSLFLSYNDPGRGYLFYTDTFLVSI